MSGALTGGTEDYSAKLDGLDDDDVVASPAIASPASEQSTPEKPQDSSAAAAVSQSTPTQDSTHPGSGSTHFRDFLRTSGLAGQHRRPSSLDEPLQRVREERLAMDSPLLRRRRARQEREAAAAVAAPENRGCTADLARADARAVDDREVIDMVAAARGEVSEISDHSVDAGLSSPVRPQESAPGASIDTPRVDVAQLPVIDFVTAARRLTGGLELTDAQTPTTTDKGVHS